MLIVNLFRTSEYIRDLYPPPLKLAGDILSVTELDRRDNWNINRMR